MPAALFDKVRKADIDMHESWSAALRYGSQFWVIPSADTFLSAGLNRQLIIVIPRRDLVIVATGGTRRDRFGTAMAPRYSFGELIQKQQGLLDDKSGSLRRKHFPQPRQQREFIVRRRGCLGGGVFRHRRFKIVRLAAVGAASAAAVISEAIRNLRNMSRLPDVAPLSKTASNWGVISVAL